MGPIFQAMPRARIFPGKRCHITGESCPNESGENPEECEGAVETGWLCPNCLEAGLKGSILLKDGHGAIFCPICRERHDGPEEVAA